MIVIFFWCYGGALRDMASWVTCTFVNAPLMLTDIVFLDQHTVCCRVDDAFVCSFQQDDAKPHSADITTSWLWSKRVYCIFMNTQTSGKQFEYLTDQCCCLFSRICWWMLRVYLFNWRGACCSDTVYMQNSWKLTCCWFTFLTERGLHLNKFNVLIKGNN